MLHEARMNFQRTIVNQAPRFPCRAAAQFNDSLHWTGSSRFRLVSMATSLTAAPGQ